MINIPNQKSSDEVSTSRLFVEVEKVDAFKKEIESLVNNCHSLDFEQCHRDWLQNHAYEQEESLEQLLKATNKLLKDIEAERRGEITH
tara:strand:+ start:1645 stop:1908 length:264 start_codon:yes stop_codon:yes gene_type:complete